jgi:hypothetical protein
LIAVLITMSIVIVIWLMPPHTAVATKIMVTTTTITAMKESITTLDN